jgi:hypothetical protein
VGELLKRHNFFLHLSIFIFHFNGVLWIRLDETLNEIGIIL